jgi:hypothetical protein
VSAPDQLKAKIMQYQHIRQNNNDSMKLQILIQNKAGRTDQILREKVYRKYPFLNRHFCRSAGLDARLVLDGVLF